MLYIFLGPDSFSRREALQRLKGELDTDGMLELNTLVLDARQVTPAEVIAACNAVPFFGAHRLVIVEGLLESAASSRGRGSRRPDSVSRGMANPWQPLVQFVDQMPQTTTLLLVDDKASGGGLLEALRSRGKLQRFELPEQRDVAAWIRRRAQARHVKIEAGASRLMADAVGNDTWMLASEIEKLASYANGDLIREEDVRALVSRMRERQGFLLADAVVEGREAQAVKLLHELSAQGDPLAVLLATIAGRYRRLAIAREMLDAGAGSGAIGEQLRASGYALERVVEQASRSTGDRLRDGLARIAQADLEIKSGVYDEELSLELLVHDLAATTASGVA